MCAPTTALFSLLHEITFIFCAFNKYFSIYYSLKSNVKCMRQKFLSIVLGKVLKKLNNKIPKYPIAERPSRLDSILVTSFP